MKPLFHKAARKLEDTIMDLIEREQESERLRRCPTIDEIELANHRLDVARSRFSRALADLLTVQKKEKR